MANNFFHFKQFSVFQDRCAMKVGTDGTLLGAWASGGEQILDIGTGTGLIALMMAQRCPHAHVTAIDCDADACLQATENVAASPFASRIDVVATSLQSFTSQTSSGSRSPQSSFIGGDFKSPHPRYNAIVCNPPFFENALKSPSHQRTTARHTVTLSYGELFRGVGQLLHEQGEFSAIIPFDCRQRFEQEAAFAGFFLSRLCAVSTSPGKPPRRFLLAFRRSPVATVDSQRLVVGDERYRSLLHDFLIHL